MNFQEQWERIAAKELLHRPQIEELKALERHSTSEAMSVIAELVKVLSADLQTYAQDWENAITEADFDRARQVAHALKGASQTGGLKRLEELAHYLEKDAAEQEGQFGRWMGGRIYDVINLSICEINKEIR